jgi:hypothetical protein
MIRAFMLLAMMVFPMRVVAAPPDGADPNGQLGIWYRSLKVPGTGQSCCNVSDCRPVDAAWIEGDHWRARVGDEVIDIPASRVLNRENPDGLWHPLPLGLGSALLCPAERNLIWHPTPTKLSIFIDGMLAPGRWIAVTG